MTFSPILHPDHSSTHKVKNNNESRDWLRQDIHSTPWKREVVTRYALCSLSFFSSSSFFLLPLLFFPNPSLPILLLSQSFSPNPFLSQLFLTPHPFPLPRSHIILLRHTSSNQHILNFLLSLRLAHPLFPLLFPVFFWPFIPLHPCTHNSHDEKHPHSPTSYPHQWTSSPPRTHYPLRIN